MADNDKQVAALRRERESYVARGLTDRIQQVDKQLAALAATESGGDSAPPVDSAPQQAEAPRKRTAVQRGRTTRDS